VWRLKMMDEGRSEGGGVRYRILASCMHAGESRPPGRYFFLDIDILGQANINVTQELGSWSLECRMRSVGLRLWLV